MVVWPDHRKLACHSIIEIDVRHFFIREVTMFVSSGEEKPGSCSWIWNPTDCKQCPELRHSRARSAFWARQVKVLQHVGEKET